MHCFKCGIESEGKQIACESCGRVFETDPDRYFKAGMEAMAMGEVERSIGLLHDCVRLNPDHVSGRFNLGLALSLADRCDEALGHYSVIAEQDPEHPGIYTALGQAAFGSYLVHIEGAESSRKAMVDYLMKAIQQDPEDVDAYFSLGNAYLAVDRPDKALPWLKNALRLHQNSAAIYYTLAKALKMLGEFAEAAEMARKSEAFSSPEDPFWDDIHNLMEDVQQRVLPL